MKKVKMPKKNLHINPNVYINTIPMNHFHSYVDSENNLGSEIRFFLNGIEYLTFPNWKSLKYSATLLLCIGSPKWNVSLVWHWNWFPPSKFLECYTIGVFQTKKIIFFNIFLNKKPEFFKIWNSYSKIHFPVCFESIKYEGTESRFSFSNVFNLNKQIHTLNGAVNGFEIIDMTFCVETKMASIWCTLALNRIFFWNLCSISIENDLYY